jgi:hypothetical protein
LATLACCCVYAAIQYWRKQFGDRVKADIAAGTASKDDEMYYTLLPSMVLVITITVSGKVYGGDIAPKVLHR